MSVIEIKNKFTSKILFEYEKENNTIKHTVAEAIKSGANLSWADLSEADLSKADLSKADLSGANLSGANLSKANLSKADLSWANLSWADLSKANLSVIKADMFYVLLNSLPELKFLKQNIIDGNIDGSTYEGECACLSGTLIKGAKITNGKQAKEVIKKIMDCRDSSRPIERFFLGIKIGDKPKNSQFSKLALEWIEEFEMLISKV